MAEYIGDQGWMTLEDKIDNGIIVWFYQGTITDGTKYRVGYREGDNSSIAVYEEIKND